MSSLSSQSLAHALMWIEIEAVPNSLPLIIFYQMWHITDFGRINDDFFKVSIDWTKGFFKLFVCFDDGLLLKFEYGFGFGAES